MGNSYNKQFDNRLSLNPRSWEGKWWLVGSTVALEKCRRNKSVYSWDECNQVFSISNYSIGEDDVKSVSEATATIVGDRKLCILYSNGDTETYHVLETDYCNYAIVKSTAECQHCDDVWIMSRHRQVPLCDLKDLKKLIRSNGFDPDYVLIDNDAIMNH